MQELVKILLIEDDKQVSEFVSLGLQEQGYSVTCAYDGEKGKQLAIDKHFDLLIVDRMLPFCDGLSIVEQVRSGGNKVPVLFLSALADVNDRIDGLKAGGDDYLVKPFAIEELLARIEVLLRRQDAVPTTRLKVGEL